MHHWESLSRGDIPPGGTAEVEVNWTISASKSKFRQTADVFTTDPENKKLTFAIVGVIDIPCIWPTGDYGCSEIFPVQIRPKLRVYCIRRWSMKSSSNGRNVPIRS